MARQRGALQGQCIRARRAHQNRLRAPSKPTCDGRTTTPCRAAQLPVPGNWECHGHGTPIYTNCAWAGCGLGCVAGGQAGSGQGRGGGGVKCCQALRPALGHARCC
jgi:hypothetical protein